MRLQRIIAVIMVLLVQRKVRAADLAERFGVSLRTVYRDVDAIVQAGVPVVSAPGGGGGYHVHEAYKVSNSLFTTADLATMLSGVEGMATIVGSEQIPHALAKLRSLVDRDSNSGVRLRRGKLLLDLHPWMGGARLKERLTILQRALDDDRRIEMAYEAKDGAATRRRVDPHCLILKGAHWYLQAYCMDRQAFRLFRVSRMHAVQLLEEYIVPREAPDTATEFARTMESTVMWVSVRAAGTAAQRLLDIGDVAIVEADEDGILAQVPFTDDEYGYGLLLGLGPGCEVVAPAYVREGIRARLTVMGAVYEARGAPDTV